MKTFAIGEKQTKKSELTFALTASIVVQALASAAALALTTIAPIIASDIQVSPQWIGYQVSLVYLFATLTSTLAGNLVRKFGPARASQIVLLTASLGLAVHACGSLAASVAASMLIGTGYALTNPASSDLLDRRTPPHQRNVIFSLKQTGVPLGGIFVGLAMPFMAVTFGWREGLLAAAILPLLLLFALQPVRASWDQEREPELALSARLLDGFAIVWRRASLRSLALMSLLFSAMQLSLASFLVVMLVNELGWPAVAAGGVAAAVQVAGGIGRVFWGFVADKTGSGFGVLAAIGCLSSMASLSLLFAQGLSAPLIVLLLCIFGASAIGWNGVMLAEAARLSPPGQVGPVAGGALMLTFFGVAIGPALFALIFELLRSYTTTYAVLALLPLLGSVLAWNGLRQDKRSARQAQQERAQQEQRRPSTAYIYKKAGEEIAPEAGLLSLPFILTDEMMLRQGAGEAVGQFLSKYVEQRGIRVMGITRTSELMFIFRDQFVENVSDLKGKKILVTGGQGAQNLMQAFGANAVSVPAPEVTPALMEGAIDGIFTSPSGWEIVGTDAAKAASLVPGLSIVTYAVLVDERWLQKLPDDQRKIVEDTTLQLIRKNWPAAMAAHKAATQRMIRKGGKVHEISGEARKQFQEATQVINAEFIQRYPEAWEEFQKVMAPYIGVSR